jgi:hypothetical protein
MMGQASAAEDQGANTANRHPSRVLAQEFGVTTEQVDAMRDRNMGYGEITRALTLAQQMPGGINEQNINTVLEMRQEGQTGWGRVSRELGVKLNPADAVPDAPGAAAPRVESQAVVRPGTERGTAGRSKNATAVGQSAASGGNTAVGGFTPGGHASTAGGRGKSNDKPGNPR